MPPGPGGASTNVNARGDADMQDLVGLWSRPGVLSTETGLSVDNDGIK